MTNNFFPRLAISTVVAFLSLALMKSQPARSAAVTYDFALNLKSGSGSLKLFVGNQYNGFFSYDDSNIFGSDPRFGGLGYVTFPTNFSLNFADVDYTLKNLVPYGRGRGGTLLQFTPSGNGYNLKFFWLAAKNPKLSETFNLSILSLGNFQYSGRDGQGSGSVKYSLRQTSVSVPEPDTNFEMLGLGVFSIAWFLRKKIASSQSV